MTNDAEVLAAFTALSQAIAAKKEVDKSFDDLCKQMDVIRIKQGEATRLVDTRRERMSVLASQAKTEAADKPVPQLVQALPSVEPKTTTVPVLLPMNREQRRREGR